MDLCNCHICASAPLMSSKSCAYTVPVLLIRLAIWLMLTPIFCSSAVCAPDGAGVDMDDIAVDQHFPGVGRKVLCAKLGHLLLDQRPFLRRHWDAQHKFPFSVCHWFTSVHSGVWGLPQDTNGKPFAGSVATLPMLAVFLFLHS